MPPIDVMLPVTDATLGASARRLEAVGFSRIYLAEGAHDPFVLAAVVTQHVDAAQVGLDVAIALARTPMTVAYSAWDLQTLSGGRFVLGLGSQVRAHITRRYSMPWSRPAARMREFVLALRTIWDGWQQGEARPFEGEFYRHTLVGPMFSPGSNRFRPPPVLLAGVGPRMIEVAGEVADGLLMHPFNRPKIVEDVIVPAVERGRSRSSDPARPFEFVAQFMVATGSRAEEMDAAVAAARAQVAFYGSTPAYREVVGDAELHERLHALSRQGKWTEMTALVPDELLEQIVIVAPPDEVLDRVNDRAGALADRVVVMPAGGVLPAGPTATIEWYEELMAR